MLLLQISSSARTDRHYALSARQSIANGSFLQKLGRIGTVVLSFLTRFIHQETGLAFWRLALSDDRRSRRLSRGHCHFKASCFHKRTCIAQFGTCESYDATCTCTTCFFLQLSITEFLSFGHRVPFTSSDVAIIAPYLPNSQLSLSLEHSICVNFQLGPPGLSASQL